MEKKILPALKRQAARTAAILVAIGIFTSGSPFLLTKVAAEELTQGIAGETSTEQNFDEEDPAAIISLEDLMDLISNAQELIAIDYTEDSWAALQDALTQAQSVSAGQPTQEEIDTAYNALLSAIDSLAQSTVDRTALSNLIDAVSDYNESDYEPVSWANFAQSLEDAITARDSATSQEAVNDAFNALTIARDDLYFAVKTENLTMLLFIAQGIDTTNLKPSRLLALEDAIAFGQLVLADANKTQDDVDNANLALANAILNLQYMVDSSELEELIASVETLDQSKYTTVSWVNLQDALMDARAVVANEDRFEEDITKAYDALSNTVSELVARANKTSLALTITLAQNIVNHSDEYIPSTIEGISELLDQAVAVYEQDDAAQAEVDQADAELMSAITNARVLADRRELVTTISQVSILDLSNYTTQSAALVTSALEQAQIILDDEDATQETIDFAVNSLTLAVNNLVEAETAVENDSTIDIEDEETPTAGLEGDNDATDVDDTDEDTTVIDDEEVPTASTDEENPTTGVDTQYPIAITACVIISLGAMLLLSRRKRI